MLGARSNRYEPAFERKPSNGRSTWPGASMVPA